MDPTLAVMWIFLSIFALTALISLGSLVGWVPLEHYYKRKLFWLLIIEVSGCVISFGSEAFLPTPTAQEDLRTALLAPELGWDWQYAEKGWRSRIHFDETQDGKLTMVGETYLVSADGQKRKILEWESSEPFDLPAAAGSVTFSGRRTWTDTAAVVYPELEYEVGKQFDVSITVHAETGLRGSVKHIDSAQTWGLVLTHADP